MPNREFLETYPLYRKFKCEFKTLWLQSFLNRQYTCIVGYVNQDKLLIWQIITMKTSLLMNRHSIKRGCCTCIILLYIL